jgi:glycosyltransferase involved in cell wall biosynthesis
LFETLDRLLLWRFDRVVVVSEPMRRVASRYVVSGRLALVPNGIELPVHRAPVQRPNAEADDLLRILAIGRLSREKAYDRLVEAVGILDKSGISLLVTIAGEGDARHDLERQIADLGLQARVRLPGYVSDVDALYGEADLFVLCSRTEGLPLVLLEAMSHGIPVVATPVGEVPAVLGHGQFGCLLDDGSPQALADGIQRIAGSPDAADVAARACLHVRAAYSVEKMAARYCEIYAASMTEPVAASR